MKTKESRNTELLLKTSRNCVEKDTKSSGPSSEQNQNQGKHD